MLKGPVTYTSDTRKRKKSDIVRQCSSVCDEKEPPISHETSVSFGFGPQEGAEGSRMCVEAFVNGTIYFKAVGSSIEPGIVMLIVSYKSHTT